MEFIYLLLRNGGTLDTTICYKLKLIVRSSPKLSKTWKRSWFFVKRQFYENFLENFDFDKRLQSLKAVKEEKFFEVRLTDLIVLKNQTIHK